MTVSANDTINLTQLNAAMKALGWIGTSTGTGTGTGTSRCAPPQPCILYFAVPPDIFPVYQHKSDSMLPIGSTIPTNVSLMVLEIPLSQSPTEAAASTSSSASAANTPLTLSMSVSVSASGVGTKRKPVQDVNLIEPFRPPPPPPRPLKKAFDVKCDCTTGCQTNRCKCYKNRNQCSDKCHTVTVPASANCCCTNINV